MSARKVQIIVTRMLHVKIHKVVSHVDATVVMKVMEKPVRVSYITYVSYSYLLLHVNSNHVPYIVLKSLTRCYCSS